MKTSVIIGLMLIGGFAWGAASGASRLRQSGSKRFQTMKPMADMVSDPDGYLRENFPWTYGTYAQARDYWYGET